MGKRKVLNKCDPAKIPRRTQPENLQLGGIMILPMNVRCLRCGNHMWRGTQLDARKEDVIGEKYLEIQVCRIHFKCKNCLSKITFKTDPQNADFIVESGASRDCRPWPNADEARDLLLKYEQEMPVHAPLKKIRSTNQMEGLFMLPMRIRCLACEHYMYTGAQFNALREAVVGEKYLEFQVYRIYFECTHCSSGITCKTCKTDPENSDVIFESGASSECNPWPNADEARALLLKYEHDMHVCGSRKPAGENKGKREKEKMGDRLRSLEKMARKSKKNMNVRVPLSKSGSINVIIITIITIFWIDDRY